MKMMKMKMKSSVCVFLFILVLLKVLYCEGCLKHEREALLSINAQLPTPFHWTDDSDCCQWDRVECNITTGRVVSLDISDTTSGRYTTMIIVPKLYVTHEYTDHSPQKWYLNYSDFMVFEDLKSLDLFGNNIAACVGNEDLRLSNLEVLDLGHNSLHDTTCVSGFPSLKSLYLYGNRFNATSCHGLRLSNLEVLDLSLNSLHDTACVNGFPSLKSLNLAYNRFNATSRHAFETLSSKLLNLEELDVSGNPEMTNILPSLGGFKSLKTLHLSNMELDSELHIQDLFSNLTNLEVLDISFNNLNDTDIGSALSGLSSLKSLNLESSQLTLPSIHSLSKLRTLEILDLASNELNNNILWSLDWSEFKTLQELDISQNEFVGPLPPSFANLSSLRRLELFYNAFTGNIGSNLASLTSLEYIDFRGNRFEVPISFTPFANHSNLKFVYGDGNKIILDSHSDLETWVPKFQLQELSLHSITQTNSLPLPNFLLYQYNLSSLDFTGCRLEGEFPNWLLENNTKMTSITLTSCSFMNTFKLPSRPLLNLVYIDLSDNSITGQIPNNMSSIFPNLNYLDMSTNAIYGSIPHDFGRMNSLDILDLSSNLLSGEIPKNMSQLKVLILSNNKLDRPLFPALSNMDQLSELHLDGNSLSGNFPSSFHNISLGVLDISNNLFVGKLPSHVENNSCVDVLSMSNNNFEGSIPTKLVEQDCLQYLDISHNKLTNSVPSFVNSSATHIHLSNNRLNGLAKRMFDGRGYVVTLDLRNNEISSNIHKLMQDLRHTGLSFLLLQGNHFTGHIPEQLCHLTELKILDLSYNNFSGPIPSCLHKIHFDSEVSSQGEVYASQREVYSSQGQLVQEDKVEFTTKQRSYTYTGNVLNYMTGIDLSSNRLDGNIPPELGKLAQVHGLNLSHNYLTGQIPATFSNLEQIESLDLSFNKLSGTIPPQLSELTFLAVFSVAHNNLSGAIPYRKGQFMTFNESSYKDNPFLCGPPLPKSCVDFIGQPPPSLPNGFGIDEHNNLVDMYAFCVSFIVSYTIVLATIAAILFINPYWRRVWFYYLEVTMTNCYYFIEDNLLFKYCKFVA